MPWARYGMTLQLYKQYSGADTCYRRAIEIEAKAFRWRYFLAVARHDDGRTKEAIDAIRGALKLDQKYAPAHVKLSEWLLLDGDLPGARAAAEEAVRQSPSSARALVVLGKAVEASDGVETALASFQKAVALAPLDPAAHYQLAMAHRKMGKPDEAQAELALHEQNRERISIEDDPLLRGIRSSTRAQRCGSGWASRFWNRATSECGALLQASVGTGPPCCHCPGQSHRRLWRNGPLERSRGCLPGSGRRSSELAGTFQLRHPQDEATGVYSRRKTPCG